MRIKNLGIDSFGKLENVDIAPDEKITVVYGKNEAGKSSIASFIKYMLYGFDSVKKQDVFENMKKKYMPWDGNGCSGHMEFVCEDGKTYTVARKNLSRAQNTVFDENHMPLTSENAGEYFFGLSENAYKKTAFIGQNNALFTDDGELDTAMRNMVYSADESVDSKKALKKLEDLRKYYLGKTGKSGALYELDCELQNLTQEREKWKDGHKELLCSEKKLSETKEKIAYNREKKQKLERERENLLALEAMENLSKLDKARCEVENTKCAFEEHYKKMQNGSFVPDKEFLQDVENTLFKINEQKEREKICRQRVSNTKSKLDALYSDSVRGKVLQTLSKEKKDAKSVLEEIEALTKKRKRSKSIAIVLTCLVLTLPIALFFYAKCAKEGKKIKKLLQEYGCESVEILTEKLRECTSFAEVELCARRYVKEAEEELEKCELLLREHCQRLEKLAKVAHFDVNDAEKYIKLVGEWLEKNENLKGECKKAYVVYNTLLSSVDIEKLKEQAEKYDETVPVRDMKTLLREMEFYTQANEALSLRERELEKKTAVLSNTLPKPAEIQSHILSLKEQRTLMSEKHSALVTAIDALNLASENMRSETAPKIAKQTSELFSKITDGKYSALYTDANMNLSFLMNGEAECRSAGYLSTGTLDAAYISLRIALCEFLYKETPTLVFDDAFSSMDDERLRVTLDFLLEISERFQIIILSCHEREKKYLSGKAKIIDFEI